MFWIGIVIASAIIIGGSVLVGSTLSRRAPRPRTRNDRQMNALKASGALRHRKSNQD